MTRLKQVNEKMQLSKPRRHKMAGYSSEGEGERKRERESKRGRERWGKTTSQTEVGQA